MNKIKFVTINYGTLFTINDGDSVQINYNDSQREPVVRDCHYIDETHFKFGTSVYHICEFAEMIKKNNAYVAPVLNKVNKVWKNSVIELFAEDIKYTLYEALKKGEKVYWTRNRRGIPGDSYVYDNPERYIEIIIDPDKSQKEYVDYELYPIELAADKIMPLAELLMNFNRMPEPKFKGALSSMLHVIQYQYDTDTIYEFLKQKSSPGN